MYIMMTVSLIIFLLEDTTTFRFQRTEQEPLEDWVAESISTVNWCAKKLQCNNSENVMCTRNRPEVIKHRKNCFNMKITATPEFRRTMLYLHNRVRNNVARGNCTLPSASNMRQLSWDVVSEATASVWISYCRVGIAKCRKTPLSIDEEGTGQNYYLLGTDTGDTGEKEPLPDSLPSFQAWAAGLSFMEKDLVSKFHYQHSMLDSSAQIVLARASTVGCSEATYGQSGFKFRALVCNYDKPPVENRTLYRIDKPCSACPKGTACNNQSIYPFLCASPEDDETNGAPIDTEELLGAVVSTANFIHLPPQLHVHYLASIAELLSLWVYGCRYNLRLDLRNCAKQRK